MPPLFRLTRRVAGHGLLVACVLAGAARPTQADPLRTATIAAGAAAAADWASTYHALKYYQVREVNPVLRPLDRQPGAMVSAGAAIDVGLVSARNSTMGRRNPRLATAGLWAMAGFRTWLAIHNIRNESRAVRR